MARTRECVSLFGRGYGGGELPTVSSSFSPRAFAYFTAGLTSLLALDITLAPSAIFLRPFRGRRLSEYAVLPTLSSSSFSHPRSLGSSSRLAGDVEQRASLPSCQRSRSAALWHFSFNRFLPRRKEEKKKFCRCAQGRATGWLAGCFVPRPLARAFFFFFCSLSRRTFSSRWLLFRMDVPRSRCWRFLPGVCMCAPARCA